MVEIELTHSSFYVIKIEAKLYLYPYDTLPEFLVLFVGRTDEKSLL